MQLLVYNYILLFMCHIAPYNSHRTNTTGAQSQNNETQEFCLNQIPVTLFENCINILSTRSRLKAFPLLNIYKVQSTIHQIGTCNKNS